MVGVKGGADKNNKVLGQIVQVQGGHVIRATGLKDRHSKVFTAKGPRDRRVRLSAQTAIQFYDVQDRLGYERPSKAVDWLINKAKDSIDKLPVLPPWDPSSVASAAASEHCQIHEDVHTGTLSPYSVNFQNYPHDQQQQQQQQHLSLSLQGPGEEITNPPVFHENTGGLFDGGFARLMGWSSQYQTPQAVAYNFQRGTLQSSNLFSHPNLFPTSGLGFGSESGYSGFAIPSQIQEDHQRQQYRDGSGSMSNTNPSSSSLSPGSSSQH